MFQPEKLGSWGAQQPVYELNSPVDVKILVGIAQKLGNQYLLCYR
jgi:hypothetical protein